METHRLMPKVRLARVIAALGLVTAGSFVFPSACSSNTVAIREPERCTLQIVKMTVISSSDMNRAESGAPRPVQLRLYQLSTDIPLLNASFDEVWKKDADTFKEDLVKVEELPIYPNSRTELEFERDDKAQVIAPVALFRQPRGRSWYTTFDLPPAPSEGQCGAECKGAECDGGPPQNPHYYVWIDESRVDDGADHADDYPEGRTMHAKALAEKPAGEQKPPKP
jgi:type VI secretion system VasD/TssJ family lipoprotein